MSNSPLVDYVKISPHRNTVSNKKNTAIAIHHMASNISVEQCGEIFQTSEASANYGIDGKGRVGMYVEECDRSWATSSRDFDSHAVTIELANDGGDPDWHVSDTTIKKCIELCIDICKRNGIAKLNYTGNKTGNLHMHRWYANTACPGNYLASKFKYIANEVNKVLCKPDLVVDGIDYSKVYNFDYYTNRYEDIRKAFGTDEIKTFNHFLKNGMKEARQAIATFNLSVYKYNYEDLRKAFGEDLPKYYQHYVTHGIKEKRDAVNHIVPYSIYNGVDYSAVYDGKYYHEHHKDVADAFLNNYDKHIQHFVNHGMREHRQANGAFNVDIYKANYPDLQKAFGNDIEAYYIHYINKGKYEKRVANRLIQQPQAEYYTYKSGDKLSEIAKKYNTTVDKIIELNAVFKTGQNIRVR